MKTTTVEKFEKWCKDIGATLDHRFKSNESGFPSYRIANNECRFDGRYDGGFFILKLIDYSEETTTGSANGIEIRELVWNRQHQDYRWYADGDKSNIYNQKNCSLYHQ